MASLRGPALLFAAAVLATTSALATAACNPTLTVGSVTATRGSFVKVAVTLSGTGVAGTQNDIAFVTNARIVKKADGTPDCTVNPALRKTGQFTFHPVGCTGTACTRVQAVVAPLMGDSMADIPSGALLYTCRVHVLPYAPLGTYSLSASQCSGCTAAGSSLGITAHSGQVNVTGPDAGARSVSSSRMPSKNTARGSTAGASTTARASAIAQGSTTTTPASHRRCGMGFELGLILPLLFALRKGFRARWWRRPVPSVAGGAVEKRGRGWARTLICVGLLAVGSAAHAQCYVDCGDHCCPPDFPVCGPFPDCLEAGCAQDCGNGGCCFGGEFCSAHGPRCCSDGATDCSSGCCPSDFPVCGAPGHCLAPGCGIECSDGTSCCPSGDFCSAKGPRCCANGDTDCSFGCCPSNFPVCGALGNCLQAACTSDCGDGTCCPGGEFCSVNGPDCCSNGSTDCSFGCCPSDEPICGSQGNCCPADKPVDCGPLGICCRNGEVCAQHASFCCPDYAPVDCPNGQCCRADEVCGSQGNCCPADLPVDCGDAGCCPAGETCGSQGDCCPQDKPVDCGEAYNGTCCPAGTTCAACPGVGVICAPNGYCPIPPPPGTAACCYEDGLCGDVPPDDCSALHGVFIGGISTCATTNCHDLGNCCEHGGACDNFVTQSECESALCGKWFKGGTCSQFGGSCASLFPNPLPCDCDNNGKLGVNELVRAVNIILGSAPVSACPAADTNHDNRVTIDELVRCVAVSLGEECQ